MQQGDKLLLRRRSAKPFHGFKHRQIGLASSVVLDTLATGNQDFSYCCGLGQEVIHKRGFANPRFAGDEHDLPFAVSRFLKRLSELFSLMFSTDEKVEEWRRRGSGARSGDTEFVTGG
jgi:hypothetical protein